MYDEDDDVGGVVEVVSRRGGVAKHRASVSQHSRSKQIRKITPAESFLPESPTTRFDSSCFFLVSS